jgi:predicted RNA-binding Zn ribbon-like protein
MIIYQKAEDEYKNLDEARLCLSFVNTNDWHASSQPVEKLNSYQDLIEWARTVNLISGSDRDHLLVRAKQTPVLAENALEKARLLREALFRIFIGLSRENQYNPADLELINSIHLESLQHARLLPATIGFSLGWESDPINLNIILWPVMRSAVDLMVSAELAYVKICADERGCGYSFLDLSRNHNRRWCSMESCGNRAKAQRHYRRAKSQ